MTFLEWLFGLKHLVFYRLGTTDGRAEVIRSVPAAQPALADISVADSAPLDRPAGEHGDHFCYSVGPHHARVGLA